MLTKTTFALVLLSSVCWARPDYVRRVPTRYGCETCHLDPRNRNLRTGFGIDFGLSRGIWAVDDDPLVGICSLDSDGDGLSNGIELGDPDCLWRVGDRLPPTSVSNPADDLDPDQCGDGVRQGGEACDGADVAEATCENQGFQEGPVSCSDVCQLDYSNCIPFPVPDAAVMDATVVDDHGLDPDLAVDSGVNSGLIDVEPMDFGADDRGHTRDVETDKNTDFQNRFDDADGLDSTPIRDTDQSLGQPDSRVAPSVGNGGGCQTTMMAGPSPILLVFGLVFIRLFRREDR